LSPRRKTLESVLVKPAGPDCNMDCGYCFYKDKIELFPEPGRHRMSDEVLEELVRQVMSQGGEQVVFTWQGGEPTLMGLPFYERVVGLQIEHGRNQHVGNALQTNGLLLDAGWARFLGRYNFLVGLSIDGPEHVHDRYRLRRGGQGTWADTVDRTKLLLDAGIAVNALAVINDYSVRFPQEIYELLKDIGLGHMQFIPCIEPDAADPRKPAGFSAPAEGYGEFLCKVFDLWLGDFRDGAPTTSVRFFDSLFHRYVGREPPECSLLENCGAYVVVEHNGDVYSCDFFVEPEWRLGNIKSDSLSGLLNSDRQQTFGTMKSMLPVECNDCEWLEICRGGCTQHRLPVGDPGALNHFCRSFKQFFGHADSRLRDLARDWQAKQIRSQQARPSGGNIGRNDPCPCGSGLKYKRCCGQKP